MQKIEKMKADAKNEDDEYAVKKAGQVLQVVRLILQQPMWD